MEKARDIIKAPIITEKSASLKEYNTYVFEVDRRANKTEIKQAIESIFNVKVADVRTSITKPKKKRVGKYTGMTKAIKKAFVKLSEGSIDII